MNVWWPLLSVWVKLVGFSWFLAVLGDVEPIKFVGQYHRHVQTSKNVCTAV